MVVRGVKHKDGLVSHHVYDLLTELINPLHSGLDHDPCDLLSFYDSLHQSDDFGEGLDRLLAREDSVVDSLPVWVERTSEKESLDQPQRCHSIDLLRHEIEHTIHEEQVCFIDEMDSVKVTANNITEVVGTDDHELSHVSRCQQVCLLLDLCCEQTRLTPDDNRIVDALFEVVGRYHRVDAGLALTRRDVGEDGLVLVEDKLSSDVTLVIVLLPSQSRLILEFGSYCLHLVEDVEEGMVWVVTKVLLKHLCSDEFHGTYSIRTLLSDNTQFSQDRVQIFMLSLKKLTAAAFELRQSIEQLQRFLSRQLDLFSYRGSPLVLKKFLEPAAAIREADQPLEDLGDVSCALFHNPKEELADVIDDVAGHIHQSGSIFICHELL